MQIKFILDQDSDKEFCEHLNERFFQGSPANLFIHGEDKQFYISWISREMNPSRRTEYTLEELFDNNHSANDPIENNNDG